MFKTCLKVQGFVVVSCVDALSCVVRFVQKRFFSAGSSFFIPVSFKQASCLFTLVLLSLYTTSTRFITNNSINLKGIYL